MSVKKHKPKCKVCLTEKLDSGACRYNCDPALANPGRRNLRKSSGVKEEKVNIGLTAAERQRILEIHQKQDPLYRSFAQRGSGFFKNLKKRATSCS